MELRRHRALGEQPARHNSVHLRTARDWLELALREEPDRPSAWLTLGFTYILDEESDPGPGVEALMRASELLPWSLQAHLGLGLLLARQGNADAARPQLQRVLAGHSQESARRALTLLESLEVADPED